MTITDKMIVDLIVDYETRNKVTLNFIELFYLVLRNYPEARVIDFHCALDHLIEGGL